MSGLNFVGLLVCLGGIILHIIKKTVCGRKTDDDDHLEMQNPNSVSSIRKVDDATDTPLLTQKSSSLTNLLNGSFSSDEDNDAKSENSSQILFHVLQRREQTWISRIDEIELTKVFAIKNENMRQSFMFLWLHLMMFHVQWSTIIF